MKNLVLITTIFALTGCTGKLYTVVNPNINKEKEQKIQGVLTYNSINVIELYETTILVDEISGNQIGIAPSTCSPDKRIKFSSRTDYSNPNIIYYDPGFLETNKFSVTLDKGVLNGVNTESSPSSAFSGIAELIPFVKAPKTREKALNESGKPLCNAGNRLKGVYKAPEIQNFEKME